MLTYGNFKEKISKKNSLKRGKEGRTPEEISRT